MAPLNLTFGIELEFIALYAKTYKWSHPQYETVAGTIETGAGGAIFWALLQAGIPATGWEPDYWANDAESYSRWTVESDSLWLSKGEQELLPAGYKQESIEISSPIFRLGADDWQVQIRAVFDVLAHVEASTGCRFIANASTGFHVHVGNGAGQKMPLETAKKILQLTTAFERVLDQLHASNRIGMPGDYCIHFSNAPLSFFHQNNGFNTPDAVLFDWLASIEGQSSHEGLAELFRLPGGDAKFPGITEKIDYCHNSSVNVENCCEDVDAERYASDLKGTVEFRQHTGTLDLLDILAWTSLTVRLAEYCHEVSDMEFLALCAQGVDTGFGVRDLLSAVGVHGDVVEHYLGEGFIGAMAADGTTSRARRSTAAELAPLLLQNEEEQAQRSSPEAIAAAIATKAYGLDPKVRVSNVPAEAIPRYYQAACTTAAANVGHFMPPESIASLGKWYMLKYLANLYRGQNYSAAAEALMAEAGPVAYFGRERQQ